MQKSKFPGNKALRKGRRSLPGYYYLLTTATVYRKEIFNNPAAASIVLNSLQWLDQKMLIKLDTAVVMPDHLHFIAQLGHYHLPEIMKKFKGFTALQINGLLGRSGHLWQPGYFDHAIRRDEVLNDIRLYCLHNPVRAGLVKDFHEYPYWICDKYDSLANIEFNTGESRLKAAPTGSSN